MTDPHRGLPVLAAGVPLAEARAAMILVHGRGASGADVRPIAAEVMHPGIPSLAPEAAGDVWFPHPFTAPVDSNEPYLGSALGVIETLLTRVEASIPAQRVLLLGFSQGAGLVLEFAARHARRYGGVVGLSGGLIGPDGTSRDYPGSFEGTPVFVGCSDVDPYIRKERFLETAEVFERMNASVTARLYPGMGHTVSPDEIESVREIVE